MTAEHSKALSAFRASAATELATALHLQAKQVQQASAEQLQRVQSQLQAQCAAVATDAERYRAQAEYTNREVKELGGPHACTAVIKAYSVAQYLRDRIADGYMAEKQLQVHVCCMVMVRLSCDRSMTPAPAGYEVA